MIRILIYITVMAGVTYLIRLLPLVLLREKIRSPFIRSFLYYVPFVTLSAMTFPAIFRSTSSVYSAVAGLAVILFLSVREKNLMTVAFGGAAAVVVSEILLFGL